MKAFKLITSQKVDLVFANYPKFVNSKMQYLKFSQKH